MEKEFTDTYSDDLITIIDSRESYLTNPLTPTIRQLVDASYTRLLTVFSVGCIEYMLDEWKRKDTHKILNSYHSKNVNNGERVKSLCQAFIDNGVNVDKDIFNDYLAIKYIRNAIIHGAWKGYEKEWVMKRDFPIDTRELVEKHFNKILSVVENMNFYIFLTGYALGQKVKSEKIKLEQKEKIVPLYPILEKNHFQVIHWRNIENIDASAYSYLEEYATKNTVFQDGDTKDKITYYKRLFDLSSDSPSIFNAPDTLIEQSIFSWNQYANLTELYIRLPINIIDKVNTCFDDLFKNKIKIKGPYIEALIASEEMQEQYLETAFPELDSETRILVAEALMSGKDSYQLLPNSSVLWLFCVHLPILFPKEKSLFKKISEYVNKAYTIGRKYYDYVEHNEPSKFLVVHDYQTISDYIYKNA